MKLAKGNVFSLVTKDHDPVMWRCRMRLSKWFDLQGEYPEPGRAPDSAEEYEGNILTTVGAGDLWKGLTGGSLTVFSNANAYIGVGDGNGSVPTVNASDTDLTATTNKLRVAMDSTFPTLSTNTAVFQSTYGTSQANFAWNEWGVFNASSSGDMLNHKGQALGTKVNTASWQLKVTLSLS